MLFPFAVTYVDKTPAAPIVKRGVRGSPLDLPLTERARRLEYSGCGEG